MDVGFGQRVLAGLAPEVAQQLLGLADGGVRADDAEHVAAVGDLHAQAQFDHAQVAVERAAEVGQALGFGGFEGEFGNGA